jgi:DNA-binding MarR family transcriptional regulator
VLLATDLADDEVDRLRAAVGRLSRQLRRVTAGSGLTPTQVSVLWTIVLHGPIGMGDLAEREGLNPTMLSRLVSLLGERDLVVRTADPSDRRAVWVQATAAGKRLRTRMQRERSEALRAHLDHLDAGQREALRTALPILETLAEDLRDHRA